MNSKLISRIAIFLLILLWVYAAISKLADYETSRSQMLDQVFPIGISKILVLAVPVVELIAAALLLFRGARVKGLMLSMVLLTSFGIYILLVILNSFSYVPCSCGGIIDEYSWEGHLLFNLFFIGICGSALFIEIKPPTGEHIRHYLASNQEKALPAENGYYLTQILLL